MAQLWVAQVRRHMHQFAGGSLDRTDAELLDQFVAGQDEAAFEALLRRHGPLVLHVCRRVLRDGHAAEDAFQATFLVLAKKAASIRRGAMLSRPDDHTVPTGAGAAKACFHPKGFRGQWQTRWGGVS
jgi:hypothetical protein